MQLTTPRLHLRPLRPDDALALHAAYGDPRVMAFWDSPALPSLADTAEMVGRQCAGVAAGTHLYWAVERDRGVVGAVDLSDIDRAEGKAEVGFILVPSAWGHGFAREAMVAVIEAAFGSIGLRTLTARFHAGNAASRRLLGALGFAWAQDLPASVHRAGEMRDCALWRLDRA